MVILLFIFGFILLVIGAEILIRGASGIASKLGIPPLIIGLTIVAFGTSAPELSVSVMASFDRQSGVALGNVIGSNIFNTLFILGISALITPLIVSIQLVRFDVPVMLAVSVLAFGFSLDGSLNRFEGSLLFVGLIFYTLCLFYFSKGTICVESAQADSSIPPKSPNRIPVQLVFILGGLTLLVLGSKALVHSAVQIAAFFGISELIIGLTVVAVGTSLPEVAASVMAGLRGERDLAVGNVIGSNLFNLLGVLGLSAVVSPMGIPVPDAALWFDFPIMVGTAAACLPIFFTGYLIARWEGGLFLIFYMLYVMLLVLSATHSPVYESFEYALIVFVVPLTAITLGVCAFRQWKYMKHKP